ncbi:prefoldin subunit 6-like [Oppia nitens]|uniref:prefoldin subunit 6-like n=1 Tax=Oppia nitens TaxID=1686743 RepID=UPI0023D9FF6A|nr:prefoldin subunit 6-like [Oppia nitens]
MTSTAALLEGLQKQLSDEINKFGVLQKSYQKTLHLRQQLDSQLNENNIVKEEMDLLEDDAKTYKLVGPLLQRIDLKEAKDNVNSRIKYISEEIKRHDKQIADLSQQQDQQREVVTKLQQQLQQFQMKATTAAK